MIGLESSGGDCTVEAGFSENSVYSTYTHSRVPDLRRRFQSVRRITGHEDEVTLATANFSKGFLCRVQAAQ